MQDDRRRWQLLPMPSLTQTPDFDALMTDRDALIAPETVTRLLNVNSDLRITRRELVVLLDRGQLKDLDVPARDTATTPGAPLSGRDVRRFTSDSSLHDVVLHLDPAHSFTPAVKTKDPLGMEARVEDRMGRHSSITTIDPLVHAVGERAHLEAR